jgi:hypothetical protein
MMKRLVLALAFLAASAPVDAAGFLLLIKPAPSAGIVGALLLEDNSSILLLEDNSSDLCLEGGC